MSYSADYAKELEGQLAVAHRRIEQLETENQRLRNQISAADVWNTLDERDRALRRASDSGYADGYERGRLDALGGGTDG